MQIINNIIFSKLIINIISNNVLDKEAFHKSI